MTKSYPIVHVYVSFAESVERVIRWNGETLEIKTEGKQIDINVMIIS